MKSGTIGMKCTKTMPLQLLYTFLRWQLSVSR